MDGECRKHARSIRTEWGPCLEQEESSGGVVRRGQAWSGPRSSAFATVYPTTDTDDSECSTFSPRECIVCRCLVGLK